jgi:hypothetical protein
MADTLPLSWKIRRFIWDTMFILIYKKKEVEEIPLPPETPTHVSAIPMVAREPEIPIRKILVADVIPGDEYSKKMHYAYLLRRLMYKFYPANQPGLPGIDADIDRAVADAFNDRYQALYKMPQHVAELRADNGHVDLGAMALNSPYACFLQKDGADLVWDFRNFKGSELNKDLVAIDCRVLFEPDPAKPGQVRVVEIDCAFGKVKPTDPAWPKARAIAMCAASTQVSLVRHFNWVHLACGAHFAIATRNRLGWMHPVCRLVWPHMYGTQNSNYLVTAGQMLPNGEFETIFSFTHAGMCDLFERTHNDYRINVTVPAMDWAHRGLDGLGLKSPVQENMVELYDVMHAHATRYLDTYYKSDADLRADAAVVNWLHAMDTSIPNGVQQVCGPISATGLTKAGLARLVAGLTYMAAVQHEALGSIMWNYQLWVDEIPVRIYKDGRRLPVDIYQRLLNANFNLNVRRAKLLHDFDYMGLAPEGPGLFRLFMKELKVLDDRYASADYPHHNQPWLIRPSAIDANINA